MPSTIVFLDRTDLTFPCSLYMLGPLTKVTAISLNAFAYAKTTYGHDRNPVTVPLDIWVGMGG